MHGNMLPLELPAQYKNKLAEVVDVAVSAVNHIPWYCGVVCNGCAATRQRC
jgi:hypothetical protein